MNEEKKLIERIEDTFYSDLGKGIKKFQTITLYEDGIQDVRKLLDLYQHKKGRIEELKQELLQEKEKNEKLVDKTIQYDKTLEKLQKDTIWKDKIREKIKELEGQEDWYIENKCSDDLYGRIDELKELLEED